MTQAPGIDVFNQPLRDAWWTPGFTAQNQSYIPVPPNQFLEQGFPPGVVYVTVIGNFFDFDANPLSGFFTFLPSSSISITTGGGTTIFPQRLAGQNFSFQGMNQFGSGKVYLWNGQLSVNLLATDNPNMTPASFVYQVTENFSGGSQYNIMVPSASAGTPVDIHSLIVPGSVISALTTPLNTFTMAVISTEFIVVDVTALASSLSANPTIYPVQFAFMTTPAEPGPSNWINGQWASSNSPFISRILVGPANGGVSLGTGSYNIWLRIIANPQVPAAQVGTLVIY